MTLKPVDLGTFAILALIVVGIFVLVGVGRDVPVYLQDALKIGVGVAFRSGYAVANDYRHSNAGS